MTGTFTIETDSALIESILARGFDPAMPVLRDDFLALLAEAEAIDRGGMRALSPAIARLGVHFGETGNALVMPIAVGHRWFTRLLDTSVVTFDETAISDALVTLVRRLVPVLQQVVHFEAIVSRSARTVDGGDAVISNAEEQSLLNAWLNRWQTFPVLASLVTLTLVQWLRALEEMIRALERDHAALAALACSTKSLTIRSLHGDAGDPHLGGRSVMILTFADGARVVFKPKQLAITDVFRSLVDRINAAGFSTPLRVHGAIVRDGHAWEAYVHHRPCESEAQVERFYRRMGGWIRLLQMFEGRDFWLDNLIADSEYPIFIDLETIMQPRRRGFALSSAAERVQNRIDSSPLVTNIIALPVPIAPNIGGEDLGCFASPKDFLSPFPATQIPGIPSAGASRDGYRTWTHPEHAPMLNGQPAPAERWFGSVEAGYREMAETIDALVPELLDPNGLVDQMCALPVRTIFRDTWTCIRIIHRSTAPPLLGSFQRRRQFLERMDREALGNVTRADPVIAAEVRAMIALDVPFFSAFGNDSAIHPPDGAPIPNFFDGTARERVLSNFRTFSSQRLEDDISLLRTSFWTMHPRTPVPSTTRRPTSAPIEADSWLTTAHRITSDIAAARVAADDGTTSWIALTYHPSADFETVAPIGNDLLTGRAGLVSCFSDQWRTSGDVRWRDLAVEAALEVARAIEQATSALRAHPVSETPVLLGAFTGVGGMLATVKLASETLGEMALDRVFRNTLDGIDWESAIARTNYDVVSGSIGLGLALTARKEWIEQLPDRLRDVLAKLAFAEDFGSSIIRSPGANATLAALPGERVAQLLIRSRLGASTESQFQIPVEAVLESDPSVGDVLGIIELSKPGSPWWELLSEVATKAIEKRRFATGPLPQLDAAELTLAMWRSSGDDAWHKQAQSIVERWIAEYEATGSWFPGDLADDRYRLSSVWGLPAIASLLRRIGGAPTIASPRTVDWRIWKPQ